MSIRHAEICRPVAGQIRLSMLMASAAQALKLAIWVVMIKVVFFVADQPQVPYGLLALLLVMTVVYYTLKIKAHDESHYAAFRLERLLRQRLSHKIGLLPLGTVRETGSGAFTKVLLDDVHELHAFMADAPPLKAEAYATPPMVLLVLFYLDWRMASAVLVFSLLIMLALRLMFARGQLFRREYGQALAQINAAIIEYVQGMGTIRTFDAGESSYSRFQVALSRFDTIMAEWLGKVGLSTRLARSLFTPMPMMMMMVGLGAWLHQQALLPVLTLFAFLVLAAGLIETMHPYMGLFHLLEKSRAAIERINELENMQGLPEPALPKQAAANDIAYHNVSFAYRQGGNQVLSQIDLHIPEHSFTAVIGASGSGKTTLVNVLLRFWDVSAGSIRIGGIDIREMAGQDLMARCSVVFQDNFLFAGSIADNIAYGLENVSGESIRDAAEKARIHDFIMTLPQQYDTQVGERGQLLSGGQKQRLTIARAFLQNRPILILDEPTAFSDAKNEAALVAAFRELMQQKTVIMVAHRLSNIVHADQIVLMSAGKIAAKGPHEQLLHTSEAYRQLWQEYRQSQNWSLSAQERAQ